MKDFENFTKIVGDLNKIMITKGYENVAQSAINRPIWSLLLI